MLQSINPIYIDNMTQTVDTIKGTPWEGIGQPLPKGASLEQTLGLAGLDWKVLKRPAWVEAQVPEWQGGGMSEDYLANKMVEGGPVKPIKVPGNYVLMRDDTMQPISPFVGERYKPIQNSDAFEVFREFCEAGNMTMETAGSLFGGQHIWGLARIEGDYELVDGEIIRGYFLLMQSHQYGCALKAHFTPVRYPGGHTLVQAVKRNHTSTKTYSMPHSRHFNNARINEIKEVIGVAEATLQEFVHEARELSRTVVTEADAVMYFIETFNTDLFKKILNGAIERKDIPTRIADLATWEWSNRNMKKVPDFMDDYEGADLSTCRGTAWGIMQATNYAFDHVIGNNPDTRLMSSWMGVNAKAKMKALSRVKGLGK